MGRTLVVGLALGVAALRGQTPARATDHAHISLTPQQKAIDKAMQHDINVLDVAVFHPNGTTTTSKLKPLYSVSPVKPHETSSYYTRGEWQVDPKTHKVNPHLATSFYAAETLLTKGHKKTETITLEMLPDGTALVKDRYTDNGVVTGYSAAVAPVSEAQVPSSNHVFEAAAERAEDITYRFLHHQAANPQPAS